MVGGEGCRKPIVSPCCQPVYIIGGDWRVCNRGVWGMQGRPENTNHDPHVGPVWRKISLTRREIVVCLFSHPAPCEDVDRTSAKVWQQRADGSFSFCCGAGRLKRARLWVMTRRKRVYCNR